MSPFAITNEMRLRHGHSRQGKNTRTYVSWSNAMARCNNPKNGKWSYYGGRGIKVCDRWKLYENFLADMGERPDGTTLDRFPNNNGNYEPGNCRWATWAQQCANRRSKIKDIAGRVFGRLTVVSLFDKLGRAGESMWVCTCLCGTTRVVIRSALVRGKTKSCGCYHREMGTRSFADKVSRKVLPL